MIYIRKRADTTHIKKELQDLAYDLTETKNSDTTIDEMWDNFENNIHRIMTLAYRKEWLARWKHANVCGVHKSGDK